MPKNMPGHVMSVSELVSHPIHDELPLHLVRALQAFEKWVVDFIGPINPPVRHSKERYIITTIDYLTHWDEAEVVRDFSIDTTTWFYF
jgi:hypothetical protein